MNEHTNLGRRRLLQAVGGAGIASIAGCTAFTDTDDTISEAEWVFTKSDLTFRRSSPTVVNGLAYIGSFSGQNPADGTVFAVDTETGEEEWAFTDSTMSIPSAPTVADGIVYAGADALYAIDAETGDERWVFDEWRRQFRSTDEHYDDSVGSVSSSPVVSEGTVFFGTNQGAFHAVDAQTGDEEWSFWPPDEHDDAPEHLDSSPTVADGVVYVGSNDESLYAIDAETGEMNWRFTEPDSVVRSSPTVADGVVFVGSYDETLYAIDAETGEQEWAFTDPSGGIVSSPTVANGIVYVGEFDRDSDESSLWAVDAETGETEWEFPELSLGADWSSPTVADGVVIIGTSGGSINAVDAQTGEEAWTVDATDLGGEAIRTSVTSSPTVVDGIVYVAASEGLFALDAGLDGSSDGSRVRLGTLGHHDEATGR